MAAPPLTRMPLCRSSSLRLNAVALTRCILSRDDGRCRRLSKGIGRDRVPEVGEEWSKEECHDVGHNRCRLRRGAHRIRDRRCTCFECRSRDDGSHRLLRGRFCDETHGPGCEYVRHDLLFVHRLLVWVIRSGKCPTAQEEAAVVVRNFTRVVIGGPTLTEGRR
jgi:hypothetical protein